MIELVAVRHGETDWNLVRRLQGHTDIALNAAGVEQAGRLAAALADEPIAAIHSSDLARALATAEPVAAAFGLTVRRHPALRERHYGILEGNTYAEILERHPEEAARMDARDASHTIEGGESQQSFFRRVVDAVRAIADEEETRLGDGAKILVVTHGGVLDMLYRVARDIALDAVRPCPIPNAVINRIVVERGRMTVTAWAAQPQAPSGTTSSARGVST